MREATSAAWVVTALLAMFTIKSVADGRTQNAMMCGIGAIVAGAIALVLHRVHLGN
jgi:hypothetical protein